MKDSPLPKQLLVCAPMDGKRAAGRQKYRWNDLVSRDLKSCGLGLAVESLNVLAEKEEKRQKDERKKQREETSGC